VEPHVREITFDLGNPKILYAALQVGFMLKSTDGGATWKLLDRGLDADVHAIAIDPDNSNRIFIASGATPTAPGRPQEERSTGARMGAIHGRPLP